MEKETRAVNYCDVIFKAGKRWPRLVQQATLGATLLPPEPSTPEHHRLEAVQGKAACALHDWLET